ncbi:MAG TPA: hypothetical protein PK479_10135 [Novosphingobium sp.]|nr:hypothetical protein [Novosphingobium sp.]HNN55232.1 hypothetical protein [Novosphingobium sp.]
MKRCKSIANKLRSKVVGPALLVGVALSAPASAQPALEEGFSGALRGCEEWVLNPASWTNGPAPFVAVVGLGDKMGLVETTDEATLPPKRLRVANHYWRINSTENAGYVLVVSDRLAMCHITGGGSTDLQPVVETILASDDFRSRWERLEDQSREDMISTTFRSREEPSFIITVSRATKPGQRQDRVQVLATALFETGN